MESDELLEMSREIGGRERLIGVTMAVTAAFLAMVTLMGHRLHTEEVVMQTKAADEWAYYQAKNNRAHMYANDSTLAELTGAAGAAQAATDWKKKSDEERGQAEDIRRGAENLDRQTEAAARRASVFDVSEICLEVGIVLSSIALLTRSARYWVLGFIPSGIGLIVAVYGLLR